MNNIYRLVWNRAINQWVVACEFARSTQRGASCTRRAGTSLRSAIPMLSLLSISLGLAGIVQAAPFGGQITAGTGTINQAASTTTIQQSSQNLSLNWQGFNVAANEAVNFVQPGSNSIAVNRIQSSTASQILGHLNANGQVWLINPNGILFGHNAQVNVGGLVASTLNVSDNALGSSSVSFSGSGTGSIINKGTITAASGGYVALIGNTVSNQGVISATLGTVALGGGSAETLTFSGDKLVHLQVDQSTLDNLAENKQLIQADGGQVTMTAGAKDTVLASVVNNTGVIYARTVNDHNGVITLLGGMQSGQVNVGGTLDASAPNGGNGGAIETSAAQVRVANNAIITASARQGQAGTWLIDPTDLTIDASAATTIASTLTGGTSVTEQTTANGASGSGTQTAGAGDINVNAAINWTNVNPSIKLTLSAYHAINVNAAVHGTGSVVMEAAGGNITIGSAGSVSGDAGVTLATGANFVNNAGASAVSASASKWVIYSTSPTLDTLGGLIPNFIQYNAPYQTTPALAAGNASLYSIAPTLTVTGLSGAVSKTYDGNTSAALSASNVAVSGLINSDTFASMAGIFGSSNAGTNMAVSSSLASAGLLAKNTAGIDVYGYGIVGPAVTAGIGTITPAALTASIIGTPAKVYDGTMTATLIASNYALAGFTAGQSATVNQPSSVSYGAANAGAQTVSATFSTSNFVAGGSTNLLNYTLPTSASGAGVINKAAVEVTGVLSSNKIYNGTATDALNTTNAGIYGVIPIDSGAVVLVSSGASGQFLTSNVGNNLAVSVSGFALSGNSAANYQIVEPSNLVANITPKSLTITGLSATNKVYDATRADALNISGAALSGVVNSDASNVSLSSSNATGAFASANVGSALAVSSSGFGISGTAALNYQLVQPTGLVADITPAALAISLIGNPTKVYNGSSTAALGTGNFSVSGFISGESATVLQTTSATYSSPNAGTQAVTSTLSGPDFSAANGTLLSNYSFPSSVTGIGTITPAPLTVAIANNPTKVYDGATTATLSGGNYALSGFVPGQSATISHASGVYASANVGVEAITTSVLPSDYTAGQGTLLSNYILPASVSGFGTITPLAILMNVQASIINNPSKSYDGSSVATLNSSNYSLSGFVHGDGASVNQTVGHYSSVNAGAQPVSATLTTQDFVANAGTTLTNYTLPTTAYGTGTITPIPLSVLIVNNPTKTYNGATSTVLSASNYVISGFIGSESAQINQSALINYAAPNAGAQAITATLMSSDFTPNGAVLTNYVLPTSAVGTGHITPAPLYVRGVLATDKVYNTTTADVLNTTNALLSGVVASDVANVTLVDGSASGTFSTASAGNNLAVSPTGFSLSGSAIGNYVLQPITGLAANITQASLSILGVTASNKSYDATNAATLNDASANLSGILTGSAGQDSVTLITSGATGTFGSVNIGNQLAVGASGFALAGAQAGNYVLSQPTGLTADITPAVITAVIIGNPTKSYDSSSSTTLTAANYTLSGFVAGQSAAVPQSATANYTSPDAGTNVSVASTLVLSDFVASAGTQLSNYALPPTAAGLGTITPAQLTAIIVGNPTKTYDNTTPAALTNTNFMLSGFVGSQGAAINQTVGTYGSANAGPESVSASLTANNFSTATGTNSNNYIFPVSAVGNGTITPAPLSVLHVSTTPRVYDGTTVDVLTGATLSGTVYLPDAPILGNFATGTLSSSGNVGTDTVTTAMTLTGPGSSNYIVTQPTGLTAVISPAILSATSAVSRAYDGTNVANLSGTHTTFSGFVSGQGASVKSGVTGTFSQPNFGSALAITGGALTTGDLTANNGTLLTNYTLPASDNGIGNITPAILTYVATPVSYQYGLNIPSVQAGSVTGFVHGETLSNATTGTLAFDNRTATSTSNVGAYSIDGSGLTANNGNYTFVAAAGNATALRITPAPLTVIGVATTSRVYDGTTVDILTGATLAGTLYNQDTPTLGNATTGTLGNNGNVGNDTVTTAMTLTGVGGTNYAITQPTGLTAIITPATLSATSTATRAYDGSTMADLSGSHTVFTGFISGQGAVVKSGVTGNFSQPDVGNNLSITGGALTAGNLTAANGTLLSNYTLPSRDNGTGSISAKVINLTGARIYDALIDADANIFGTIATGVSGESLSLSGSGSLSNKSVGSRSVQSLGSLQLVSGTGQASNYTLVGGIDTATITPLAITVNATGHTKVYDANTTDAVTLASTGVLSMDAVTFANSAANFTDKNVGQSKTVNVTGITKTGLDADNYSINTAATATANITQLAITVNATGTDKKYNANTIDTVTLASTGVLNLDTVIFANSAANFTDKNVGQTKTVNVTGIIKTGIDAGNYSINTVATTTANITPLAITVNAVGTDKVYNGNAIDTVTLTSAGVLGTDKVAFTNAAANFTDKNVGQQKIVSVTGIADSGIDAGNYVFSSAAATTASITPAIVNLNGSRLIDGSTNASAGIFGTSGTVSGSNGETLALTGSGTLASKNIGIQPVVSLGNLALNDGTGLASNYTLIGGVDSANLISASEPIMSMAFIQSFLNTDSAIPTPYGIASSSAIANFTGNHKKTRYNPIEASGSVSDFQPGLDLNVQDAGVRLPNGVSP
ncbi:YDG domain-containing protein [Glaciimonas sp. GNP009]